jgi:hypothetical protein
MMHFLISLYEQMIKISNLTITPNPRLFPNIQQAILTIKNRHNPYHNFKHGVTVMQGVFYFTSHTPLSSSLSDLQKLASIFAGLVHDIDHTGHSNLFESNSLSD